MEPFYQLSRLEGAIAENSLTLDYRASINIVASINALCKGHYLVWWSGLVSLAILFIAPLASEAVFIGFAGSATCTGTSKRVGCLLPTLSVFPPAARAVEGILAFVVIMTLGLAIAIRGRNSGACANPFSVAGLATLFQDPSLIEKFRQIQSYSPNSREIANALQGSRYRVGGYVELDRTTRNGMHLLSPRSNPFTGFFHSLRHAHFFNAYISVVAILCEPLIFCLANVPFKPGHSFIGYTVATWLAVAILLMMLFGVAWKLCRKDANGADAARRPDTIAGVLVQICGSHMLGDFAGMAELDEKRRNRTVMGMGKKVCYG